MLGSARGAVSVGPVLSEPALRVVGLASSMSCCVKRFRAGGCLNSGVSGVTLVAGTLVDGVKWNGSVSGRRGQRVGGAVCG